MLDSFVAGAQARGMQVLLTPTGPIPAWASRCGGSLANRRVCKPDPQLFGAFVRALGTRYTDRQDVVDLERAEPALVAEPAVRGRRLAGRAALGQPLPRARQRRRSPACAGPGTATRRSGSARPRRSATTRPAAAPSARCASRAAARAEDPQDLAGDVPARRLLPEHQSGKRLTGTEGSDQRCGGYKRLNVTGYAHHPYTRGGSRPPLSRTNSGRDHDQRRLAADAAARQGGAAPSGSRPSCRSTTPSTAGRPSRT